MPLLILCSRLFVKIMSIRIAVEEVMQVGSEIRGNILLDSIRLMNSLPPQGFRPEAKSRGGTLVARAYIKDSTYSSNMQSVY